ncbi:hypothetical protein DV736_g4754, partial [Chaetothyriales sp. CBS 134916]
MAEKTTQGVRSVSISSGVDVKIFNDGVQSVTATGETHRMSASVAIDPAAEKRLVWKFDLRILPTLAVMYLFNSLDKSNLGNAKTAGLEKDLGLHGDDYNMILSIFFVPYVLTAPLLGIAGKKYGPSRVLPLMMFSFGFFTLMVVTVHNFGGLFAIRWFLGMSESAFFPLVIYYQTTEKQLAFYRIQVDSSAVVGEKFNLKSALGILKHPTSWIILGIEVCLGVPLQSVSLFLPVITKALGYPTVMTNLYTVAPNVTGAVMLLVLAFASDLTRLRFPFIALGFAFTFIGFAIYATLDVKNDVHVAYFSCFMMTWGTSAPSVILDVWYNNNIADENKRSNIFQNKDAPKYLPALTTTAIFGGKSAAAPTMASGNNPPTSARKRGSRNRLQKRNRDRHRLPSSQIPSRLQLGDDAQDDVSAPDQTGGPAAHYMHQSVFSMIAAAGSRTNFTTRFDDSSESEDDDQATKTRDARDTKDARQSPLLTRQQQDTSSSSSGSSGDKAKKPASAPSPPHSFSSPSVVVSAKTGQNQGEEREQPDLSPSRDSTGKSSHSNPRDAPVMSRLITAEAEFQAANEDVAPQSAESLHSARNRGDSSPATLLATRLMEIFAFEKPETVIAEYPCWLLKSVLLQGYLYLTPYHICFYAYLPKRSSTISRNGYLSKRGKSNARYNRCWFVLKGDVLSYYSHPAQQYFPQNSIDLRYGISANLSADKDKRKDCTEFSVTTDHRTYYFRADTPASADEWVKSLQRTIFRSHNDGDSVKISLPIDNVIDIDESPVVEFAETIKIRVIENDESYAIDEYFFSFFSSGEDVLEVLNTVVGSNNVAKANRELIVASKVEELEPSGQRARSTTQRHSMGPGPRRRSVTPLREGVRATLTPFALDSAGKMSPRMSGEFVRQSQSPSRDSGEFGQHEYGRASFDRGRRSGTTCRLDVATTERSRPRSPLLGRVDSPPESFTQSLDKETDSSATPLSPRVEAQMSASQILTRSDVFHTPRGPPMDALPSISTEPTRSSDIETIHSNSPQQETAPIPMKGVGEVARDKRLAVQHEESEKPLTRNTSSPTLQDLVKAGSYPLQRAAGFAGYLKNKSGRMGKLLATESMSYLEKVSGMWAGNRRHYGEDEAVLPDDRDVDPEDDEANVAHGDRFRAHFALAPTEKLQATYFGFLHRVLPLYGKIYISNRSFCFRSLLPGTKTKLVLPLKDVENVDKEKGFRFGYQGLVLVIRGHEELFFEFSTAEHRDDCAITLLQILESIRYMEDSGGSAPQDDDSAAIARHEHRQLQEARQRYAAFDPDLSLPDTDRAIFHHDDASAVRFDDPKVSIISFKPPTPLRITCLTIGSRGDVQPYIALCKALKLEGHKPIIATHREFQPWIEKHGIEFKPVGGNPAELMRLCVENGMFTYNFLREASSKFRGWIDELLVSAWEACQHSDLLIESPSAMAGIHIAEALQIPYFRAFGMPWTRTRAYPHAFAVPDHKIGGAYNYYSYVMFDNIFWKGVSGQVNRWRKKDLGLRSTGLDKMQPNKVPFLYNFSPSVVVPPLDYSDWVRVTGYWFLDEGSGDWTPPKELTDFIAKARADKKKLVYIGFGSIVVANPASLTKTVVESVLKADVRCILSKGWSDRLGDPNAAKVEVPLPPEIYQIQSAPHDWLFTQIDAAVHHGGAGTTGASLRAGLPTVVRPFFGDQFFWASRIEDLGVGICLKKVNVSLLARALWEAVHSERMIVKARLLGEQIRKENGVDAAIQCIYRDLDYAQSLIKAKAVALQGAAQVEPEDDLDIEENWTFIGDESDPQLQRLNRYYGVVLIDRHDLVEALT